MSRHCKVPQRAFTARSVSTYVNNAFIQTGNIDASNGIVHAISRVLLPPTH